MLFSKIVGGPDFDDVAQFEAVLHDVTLKYMRLSASQSERPKVQVVNYLQRKHKFEPNEYGRGVYKIDGGYWEYGKVFPFLRHLPAPAGYFRFKIFLTKKNSDQSLEVYLKGYLDEWLTKRNKGLDVNDDVDKKYIVSFPKFTPIKISDYDGIYYRLHDAPGNLGYIDNYVVPINNEYMLNVEIDPETSLKPELAKIVGELNDKAAKIIVDSLDLVPS